MPVTFPKGSEPAALSAQPNGPQHHAGGQGELSEQPRHDGGSDKASAQDFQSKGPALSDNFPAAASKDELKARKAELNEKKD